jgi:hypothetical protein
VPFGPATRRAFERLADEHRRGRILVTTTRRLLDFAREREEARWECDRRDGVLQIDVRTPGDGSGLTFAVGDPQRVRLVVNGRPCEAPLRGAEGSAGERVIGVPWRRLEWPRP